MTAQDYPVEFGYGAQDGTYYGPRGSVGLFHRGNDRYTPAGTPIVVAGVTIGLTGATGLVSGPHLHTQAWTGTTANTQDPTPFDFKPGRVVAAGTASQWGNYITIEVNGVNLTYAHLSQINVSAGQVIGAGSGGSTTMENTIKSMYLRLLGREADAGGLDHYKQEWQRQGAEFVYIDLKNSAEGQADWDRRNPDRVRQLEQAAADAQAAIQSLSSRPTKEELQAALAKVDELTKKLAQQPTPPASTPVGDSGLTAEVKKLLDKLNAVFK